MPDNNGGRIVIENANLTDCSFKNIGTTDFPAIIRNCEIAHSSWENCSVIFINCNGGFLTYSKVNGFNSSGFWIHNCDYVSMRHES